MYFSWQNKSKGNGDIFWLCSHTGFPLLLRSWMIPIFPNFLLTFSSYILQLCCIWKVWWHMEDLIIHQILKVEFTAPKHQKLCIINTSNNFYEYFVVLLLDVFLFYRLRQGTWEKLSWFIDQNIHFWKVPDIKFYKGEEYVNQTIAFCCLILSIKITINRTKRLGHARYWGNTKNLVIFLSSITFLHLLNYGMFCFPHLSTTIECATQMLIHQCFQ